MREGAIFVEGVGETAREVEQTGFHPFDEHFGRMRTKIRHIVGSFGVDCDVVHKGEASDEHHVLRSDQVL